jgi:DNA-binding transcriptional MerR regulator
MLDTGAMELPDIPGKRYFTIGEVSKLCDIKPHVLRYWEQEFDQLKPVKRRGNRRYYQRHEVKLVRAIRQLLYIDGFTISGARTKLEGLDAKEVESGKPNALGSQSKNIISQVIKELDEVVSMLQ